MKLGKTIQEIRDRENLTQEKFAEMFHVTRQTVSNWENEKSYPDLITLIEISDIFDVSLDTMLKGDKEMTEKLNKEINWAKRLRRVLPLATAALLVCAGAFFWLFWGITPVNSDEVEITTTAEYQDPYIDADGDRIDGGYHVNFHWKLKNGKCLEVRDEHKEGDRFPGKRVVVPYDQYKMPFDDRGDHPGEYDLGMGSSDKPFTEDDSLIIEFKDKTVEYNLKEIAEEAGIQ